MSANPFEDPSVVTSQDAYNPFEVNDSYAADGDYDYGKDTNNSGNAYENNSSAYSQQPQEDLRSAPPTSVGNSYDSGGKSDDDLDRREANLLKKERELMNFNDKIARKKERVEQSVPVEDNWPCAAYAIAYHDIKKQIPEEYQADQRSLYMIVLLTFLCHFWNLCCITILFFQPVTMEDGTDTKSRMQDPDLMKACLIAGIGIPVAWVCWYRALYWALANESTFKWLQFFCCFACHIALCITACIGIPKTGLTGILVMINAFSDKPALGFCTMIALCLWALNAFLAIRAIRNGYVLYKQRGGDLRKDAETFKNAAVISAATEVAKAQAAQAQQ